MIKALNAVSVLALIVALICMLIWGYTVAIVSVVLGSVCCIAAPVAVGSSGMAEIFTGIFEAFIEGCAALIEVVVSAISSIF